MCKLKRNRSQIVQDMTETLVDKENDLKVSSLTAAIKERLEEKEEEQELAVKDVRVKTTVESILDLKDLVLDKMEEAV